MHFIILLDWLTELLLIGLNMKGICTHDLTEDVWTYQVVYTDSGLFALHIDSVLFGRQIDFDLVGPQIDWEAVRKEDFDQMIDVVVHKADFVVQN